LKVVGEADEIIDVGTHLPRFPEPHQSLADPGFFGYPVSGNIPKMGFDLIFREGNVVSSANSGIIMAIIMAKCKPS